MCESLSPDRPSNDAPLPSAAAAADNGGFEVGECVRILAFKGWVHEWSGPMIYQVMPLTRQVPSVSEPTLLEDGCRFSSVRKLDTF